MTAHGKSGQAVVPPVKEGSKIEELSNQPSMVERTAQDLKFGTATRSLALLTAHGRNGQVVVSHVDMVNSLDLSRIKPVMGEIIVEGKV